MSTISGERHGFDEMVKQPADVDLRELPKRPFGVYVLVIILLLGVFAAVLEIARVQSSLFGFWATAEELLRDHSGMVSLASRLIHDPTLLIIANSLIIIVWVLIIIGMWMMHRWAWLLLMIITGVMLTYALFRFFDGEPEYLSMLTNVAVAFYLNDRNVQRAYARRKPEATA